ncbi:filamentous hemagglutinin N-terminal domain-containing protein [Oscillatoria sp. FACHB-1406]|nr:filamentous hemagglutinin N-terminal domain-containing protein [Oscillatoria sp. FACHB-1406]
MKNIAAMTCLSSIALMLSQGIALPVQAQSIVPATDGTGTSITQIGNRFDITGGIQTGSNLYQSFQQFGLEPSQIANFLSNPTIQNILGRVIGGDPSIINGLIQVTGGNSNLFLLNPAGIAFGSSARLNVPASFLATTANGIQIGDRWFALNTDSQSLQTLSGNPSAFAFSTSQPGSIFNAGNLAVSPGQSVTLVGGTVLNTGTVTAPGGTITITAVPGEKLVRITPQGSVLSLDLPLETRTALNENARPIAPLSLPALLASSNIPVATGVTVENGTVKLTHSGAIVPTDAGTSIAAGQLDVSSTATGGRIQVLGDKVGLVSANINASGSTGGGTVLIGGDYQGKGSVITASRTFVSEDSVINADAIPPNPTHQGGNGNGGRVIVWADDTTQFLGNISARGGSQSGDGGFVEVSGKQNLQYLGNVDTSAPNGNFGTLLLDPADIIITPGFGAGSFTGQVLVGDVGPTTIAQSQLESLPGNTNVEIQASNTITIQPLGTLAFAPGTGTITFQAGGAFSMSPNDTIDAGGRDISITAASMTLGNINPLVRANPFDETGGGSIRLTATNGGISAQNLYSGAFTSYSGKSAGEIVLNATNGNIAIADFISSESTTLDGANNRGGNITINVTNGNFSAQRIFSSAGNNNPTVGAGGDITINANTITANVIGATSRWGGIDSGKAGRITLNGVVQNGDLIRNISGSGAAVTGSPSPFRDALSSGFSSQNSLDLSKYPDNLQFVHNQLTLAGQIARGEIEPPASLLRASRLSRFSASSLNSTGRYLEADSDVRSTEAEDNAYDEERRRAERESNQEWHRNKADYWEDNAAYEIGRGNDKMAEVYSSNATYERATAESYNND